MRHCAGIAKPRLHTHALPQLRPQPSSRSSLLARHAKVDVSHALRHANAKFERRFRRMEALAATTGECFAGKPLAEQDALWNRAKREEREEG